MRGFLLILTVILFIPATAFTGNHKMSELELAQSDYKQGRFIQSQSRYQNLVSQQGDNSRVLFQLGQIALLRNDLNQALTYYKQAYKDSGWLGKRWPLRTSIASRIALAYHRQDDFANAAKWYKLAAGPIAFGPFKTLRAFQKQAEAFSTSQPYVISGPESTELPFIQLDPLPIVEVLLNGKGPYYFFIDTGGADIILSQEVADELDVETLSQMQGEFASGQASYLGLGKLEQINLGAIEVNNIPVHIHSFEGVDEILQHKIHGTVTTSLLRHFYSTIDYKNQKLVLRQVNHNTSTKMRAMSENNIAIPFYFAELHMMMARGHINDQPDTLFFIDTGLANYGFAISKWLLDAANIDLDWSQAEDTTGAGGTFKTVHFNLEQIYLGVGKNSITKRNVSAERHEKDMNIYQGILGFEVGGTISHAFFKDSSLTFDFENMRLIITQ
jgi:hypothetical protein